MSYKTGEIKEEETQGMLCSKMVKKVHFNKILKEHPYFKLSFLFDKFSNNFSQNLDLLDI